MRLLFLHGAGGYDDDQPLARALGESVGATVELPRLLRPPADDLGSPVGEPVERAQQVLLAGLLLLAPAVGNAWLLLQGLEAVLLAQAVAFAGRHRRKVFICGRRGCGRDHARGQGLYAEHRPPLPGT